MHPDAKINLRTIVAQLGARRHYAVPLAFEKAGMLEHFYTDLFLKGRCLPRLVAGLSHAVPLQSIRRISGRVCAGLPARKVTSFWSLGLHDKLQRTGADMLDEWRQTGQEFCRHILEHGLGNPDAVYAFSSAAKELLMECRDRGIKGILDHATAPRRVEWALVQEEQLRFPGWSRTVTNSSALEAYSKRQHEEADLASVIVCGSSFVKNMLMDEGISGDKIRVVPLGISLPSDLKSIPHDGLHVLFAGGEGLRKGIGYLARAADMLKSRNVQVRAVGDLGLSPEGLSVVSRTIEVRGSVPRSRMQEHMAWADVLVLPSVSETFGLVILEAMAAGLTVITTTHTCGPDVLRDEVDGFVIQPCHAESVAAKLDWMATNSGRLSEMKKNARLRAADFSLDNYSRRLADVVKGPADA